MERDSVNTMQVLVDGRMERRRIGGFRVIQSPFKDSASVEWTQPEPELGDGEMVVYVPGEERPYIVNDAVREEVTRGS